MRARSIRNGPLAIGRTSARGRVRPFRDLERLVRGQLTGTVEPVIPVRASARWRNAVANVSDTTSSVAAEQLAEGFECVLRG